jgi:hypothetical protein
MTATQRPLADLAAELEARMYEVFGDLPRVRVANAIEVSDPVLAALLDGRARPGRGYRRDVVSKVARGLYLDRDELQHRLSGGRRRRDLALPIPDVTEADPAAADMAEQIRVLTEEVRQLREAVESLGGKRHGNR